MFYKPNYCCNCGDKIERIEWQLWTNRRFCPLCETEYQLDDWLKRIFPIVFFIIGIFGIGAYFYSSEKTSGIARTENPAVVLNKSVKQDSNPQALRGSNVQPDERSVETEEKGQFEKVEQNTDSENEPQTVVKATSPQKNSGEAVYFCGAETKKGTPCSRRVRGGGRCWQHKGREAILPAKDLLIEQN